MHSAWNSFKYFSLSRYRPLMTFRHAEVIQGHEVKKSKLLHIGLGSVIHFQSVCLVKTRKRTLTFKRSKSNKTEKRKKGSPGQSGLFIFKMKWLSRFQYVDKKFCRLTACAPSHVNITNSSPDKKNLKKKNC